MEQNDYHTIKDTAQILEMTQQKIFNLLRSEDNPFPGAKKVGWQWVIPSAEVKNYKEKAGQS